MQTDMLNLLVRHFNTLEVIKHCIVLQWRIYQRENLLEVNHKVRHVTFVTAGLLWVG